jgi:hypothetical protein
VKRVLHTTLAAALLVSAAAAQFGGPGGPPPGGPPGHRGFGPAGFGPGMHSRKVVTNAPYMATATNTFTQALANGNTIQRTTTATVGRDSAGRTYEQQTITGGPLVGNNGPVTLTFINDPVAGYAYVLNPSTKVAMRRPLHTPPASTSSAEPKVTKPANPNVAVNELGMKTLNGVNATGKTMTHTFPAGSIGNAQPITATTETWFSPDLQVVVSAKRDDPRTGTSVYALTNIQRQDPPTSWFTIPSDYTIQDARGFNRGPHGQGPPQ